MESAYLDILESKASKGKQILDIQDVCQLLSARWHSLPAEPQESPNRWRLVQSDWRWKPQSIVLGKWSVLRNRL